MTEANRTDIVPAFPRLRSPFSGWQIVLMLGWLAGPAIVPLASADEPVFTNKGRFRIPYQLDAEEIERLGASEIQLHVSTDNGRTWRHVDSVPPVVGKFAFDTAGDGDYAFAVRTVDRDGNPHPPGPLTASLQVLVDTTAPLLELELEEIETGRVQVRWQASDLHLDAESLVLEHMDSTSNGWQPIQIASTANGQTSWSVDAGGTVRVRGRIRDEAGNESTAEANSTLLNFREVPTSPLVHGRRVPIAAAGPHQSEDSDISPFSLPAITPGSGVQSRSVSNAPGEQPSITQPRWDQTPASPGTMPAADTMSVRRVNSTTFQIAYELADVGPSGVSSVDLYLTENEGQKWFHYGTDKDGRSPFQVTVPKEGTYGFVIRVRSGVGLAMSPPQPHDRPELSVSVDRRPPRATLMPLRQGEEGAASNQLLIRWAVTDDALPEKPVALFVAEHKSGPWQPLTGWQRNTGQYAWNFGPEVPSQVFIRLEARDAAGNVARVETEKPLVIDLSRPTARILDVESVR